MEYGEQNGMTNICTPTLSLARFIRLVWVKVIDCAECNPANSGKDPETFTNYESVITMRFGPYINGQTALYYTASSNGGVMRQIYCENCPAAGAEGGDGTAGGNAQCTTTIAPTAAPTVYVPPVRPDGEGGYPGVLFPWSSGADCPEGYDYCGVLEFCMGESNSDTGPVYGYRLPCPDGDTANAIVSQVLLFVSSLETSTN